MARTHRLRRRCGACMLLAAVSAPFHFAAGLSSPNQLPDELLRAIRGQQQPDATMYPPQVPADGISGGAILRNLLSPPDRARSADAPDEAFYSYPMLVQHNDDAFRSKLSELYETALPADDGGGGGGTFLDLGSSWTSHLPPERQPANVWLHGMNAEELERNGAGTGWRIVRSFNDPNDPVHAELLAGLPGSEAAVVSHFGDLLLPEIPSSSVDVVGACAAFQYWRFPERVVGEILRVLRPGGCVVVSFSNRMFQSKAVGAWKRRSSDRERLRFVSEVLEEGARLLPVKEGRDGCGEDEMGWVLKVERTVADGSTAAALALPLSMMLGYQLTGDPFLAVVGRKQATDAV